MSEFEKSLQLANQNKPQSASVQSNVGRYAQEVQGMVFMAKQFPRDEYTSFQRIKQACQRKSMADVAVYAYPRGKEMVSGPSIRMAEVLAQSWGNMTHGVMELEQKSGESVCMAYAWDLETNVRSEKVFTVKHERKAAGSIKKLTDPRDIYELVANYGARRQRACILAVIPKDVIEEAVNICKLTLSAGDGKPLQDRLRQMVDKFSEQGITKAMIEKRQGYLFENFTEKDIVDLIMVYNAIKDGIGKREEYFELPKEPPKPTVDLAAEFEKAQKEAGKEINFDSEVK